MKSVILKYNFICSFLWLMICTIFKFLSKKKKLNIIRGTVICILWWQVSAKILGLYKYKIHIGNCYYIAQEWLAKWSDVAPCQSTIYLNGLTT